MFWSQITFQLNVATLTLDILIGLIFLAVILLLNKSSQYIKKNYNFVETESLFL